MEEVSEKEIIKVNETILNLAEDVKLDLELVEEEKLVEEEGNGVEVPEAIHRRRGEKSC